jgi:hypothetical protein
MRLGWVVICLPTFTIRSVDIYFPLDQNLGGGRMPKSGRVHKRRLAGFVARIPITALVQDKLNDGRIAYANGGVKCVVVQTSSMFQ